MEKVFGIILKILSHPLFITMSSIFFGTFLLDHINHKKEKRELRKKEAVKLVNDIADKISKELTWLFWQIRLESNKIEEKFSEASRDAYSFRFHVNIRGHVIFGDSAILKDYKEITKEVRLLREAIQEKKIIDHKQIQELDRRWMLQKNYTSEDLKKPYDQYFDWAQSIWFKTENYIREWLLNAYNLDK